MVNRATGKRFVGKSRQATKGDRLLSVQLADRKNRQLWEQMTHSHQLPLVLAFYIVRRTRARFDYTNILQGLLDAMVRAGYLEDDSADDLIPLVLPYSVEPQRPRVEISVIPLQNFLDFFCWVFHLKNIILPEFLCYIAVGSCLQVECNLQKRPSLLRSQAKMIMPARSNFALESMQEIQSHFAGSKKPVFRRLGVNSQKVLISADRTTTGVHIVFGRSRFLNILYRGGGIVYTFTTLTGEECTTCEDVGCLSQRLQQLVQDVLETCLMFLEQERQLFMNYYFQELHQDSS